ncbi:MAG: sodium/glutamate symporter [Lacipirellulaceae bacterium]
MLKLDMIQTVAFGGLALALGYAMRLVCPPLARYNLPAPVLGGLAVAIVLLVAQLNGRTLVEFDVALKDPLMIAFFTSIGFGASLRLLKKGGPQVLLFFGLSTVAAILQNVVGAATAVAMGQPPLFGVLCGSVTLTGGPATGLAFAPKFEEAGVSGAASIAVAAAMFGIVCGGLIGSPIATLLVQRTGRSPAGPGAPQGAKRGTAEHVVEDHLAVVASETPDGEDAESFALLKTVGMLAVAMAIGAWIGDEFARQGYFLPRYIGAMLVAIVLRNLDDLTGWLRLDQRLIDDVGNVSLSFFLAIALMTLNLAALAAVAAPLFVVLVVQVALVAALCFWPIFPWMGRDYDSAVLSGGFCGFMLGTTANSMAIMDSLVQRYGPAPRAFLIVPMVGAFFIDATNATLITWCLNFLK